MTWPEYFAIPAINWSLLKVMAESPKHFRHAQENPSEQTDAQAIGCYVHTATLEPERVAEEYAVYEGRRQGAVWDAFVAAAGDKTVLRAADLIEAEQMANALRAHVDVAALLADPDTVVEEVVMWHDAESGVDCKGRPDIRNRRLGIIADLKTAKSTDLRRFGHDIVRYQYHGQLAYYAEGIKQAEGWEPSQHLLIVVEKSAPYDVAIMPMAATAIEVGRADFRIFLDRLKKCTESGLWPGRHPKPVTLDETNLPPWLFGGGAPEISFIED